MFNNKSIYALNKKDPDAIVYTDADGTLVRLTRDDFASEDEFQKWKAWSDENYHGDEKDTHIHANHTAPISRLPEDTGAAPSPEAEMETEHEQRERAQLRKLLSEGLDSCLTPTQKRRLWMSCVEELTVREIAEREKVSFQNAAKSIAAAKKKMQNVGIYCRLSNDDEFSFWYKGGFTLMHPQTCNRW